MPSFIRKSLYYVFWMLSVTYMSFQIAAVPEPNKHLHSAKEIQLDDMPYAKGARFDPNKGCLPGTREKVMEVICNWVNQDGDDTHRIFFLHDVAGAGKSAIAHEVARRFDKVKRLGSSFCFDRAHKADRSPNNVFSTIAVDLADLDPGRKTLLLDVIGEQKAIRNTSVPSEQFEKFIPEPALSLTTVGPMVIVIDALDESGDEKSRKGLLSVLGNEAARLPSNLRVLITFRAERTSWVPFIGRSMCLPCH
jgi:hypothetical protein